VLLRQWLATNLRIVSVLQSGDEKRRGLELIWEVMMEEWAAVEALGKFGHREEEKEVRYLRSSRFVLALGRKILGVVAAVAGQKWLGSSTVDTQSV
jgi:hypothetical protein